MKYILSMLFLLSFLNIYSQRRIDLDFELLEPLNGAYVEPGVDFKFKIKLKNLSADDIIKQDTLWIYMLLDKDTVYFDPVRTNLHLDHMVYDNKSIKAGDSITFWNIMQLPMNKLNKTVEMCLSVMPHNAGSLSDTILYNNGHCVSIIAKSNPANLSQASSSNNFSLYPNPVNEFLKFESPYKIESITIMAMNGSILKSFNGTINPIDCSDFANGLYLIQIKTSEGIQTGRFCVNH